MTPDDLYGIDPEEFVPARDAIVRELRKTDKAAAAQVARLRRPTVAAYGINVVAREHPDEVTALLDAGDRLRAAQENALRGDAGALRTATEERRRAVAAVAGLVADVLGERAPAQAGAVSATLEAATVDPDVAELVRAGRLDKERSAAAAGFGFGEIGDWTPPPPREQPAKTAKTAKATKPARAAKAEPEPAPEPVKTPAKKAPATRDDRLAKELASATAEAKARAADLHDAEVRLREVKAELAEATKAVRDARTKAQRAELNVEQLRQRAWEEGERSRGR
ncbi:MAG TPA: hypothetical protein VNA20_18100 [Frankiaceae bacterium]|nr:hypothetical protein [Frankiaceae bacterium]